MPLLLAAAVLEDPEMLVYADGQNLVFQEDRQTWYISVADVGRKMYKKDGRRRDEYNSSDVGLAEWGEKHAQDPEWDARNWDAPYRTVSGGCTIGHVLTAKLMGLEQAWNWPAIFDYYARYWAQEKTQAGSGLNSIPLFVAELWRAYAAPGEAPLTDENVATAIWQNVPIAPQTGAFTVAFDLLASGSRINGITGLSSGPADEYTDLAASVRFSPSGRIDARNGRRFESANYLAYRGGVRYRVVMSIDVAAKKYSVSVTPENGTRVIIANNWDFRTQALPVSTLDHLSYLAAKGYHAVLTPQVQ